MAADDKSLRNIAAHAAATSRPNVARLEIRVALNEIMHSIRAFTLSGPAEWTRSNRHTGIRHLPLRLHKATTTSR